MLRFEVNLPRGAAHRIRTRLDAWEAWIDAGEALAPLEGDAGRMAFRRLRGHLDRASSTVEMTADAFALAADFAQIEMHMAGHTGKLIGKYEFAPETRALIAEWASINSAFEAARLVRQPPSEARLDRMGAVVKRHEDDYGKDDGWDQKHHTGVLPQHTVVRGGS